MPHRAIVSTLEKSRVMTDQKAKQTASAERPDKSVPAGLQRDCSIARTLEVLGSSWAFLVIREAFFGARRFNEFAERLRCSRSTLSRALQDLVAEEVLRSVPDSADAGRGGYALTPSGLDLYGVFLGLMAFGDRWLWDTVPPVALFHLPCRSWFSGRTVWRRDLVAVEPRGVDVFVDDDYWVPIPTRAPRRRRASADGRAHSTRPCTVEASLETIGDRWTFLVLREFFHGNHGFDEIQRNIGIASNILAGRLRRLTADGVLLKSDYGRSSYSLSLMGLDLYPSLLLMKEWGDQWRLDGEPRIHLRRAGGTSDESVVVVCSACQAVVSPTDVRYVTNYPNA
jgi:DNA-binding HxlR family transcriptional regulator